MKLARDDAGRGECVVLIHGHPFDRTLWSPQLAALRDGFRVVVPDLRGFGESPVTPGSVTMREYAADVEDLLDDLGINRAAVIGLSMGGLVTMELAGARPERYWAIGLVATTAEPVTAQEKLTRRQRADAVERDGMGVLVNYMHTGVYGPGCPPAVRARVDAMMAATSCLRHPELVVIDGAGHLPNLEAERQFNEALRGFLQAHAPGGPPSAG